jgi:hypothetical protein
LIGLRKIRASRIAAPRTIKAIEENKVLIKVNSSKLRDSVRKYCLGLQSAFSFRPAQTSSPFKILSIPPFFIELKTVRGNYEATPRGGGDPLRRF